MLAFSLVRIRFAAAIAQLLFIVIISIPFQLALLAIINASEKLGDSLDQ